MKMIRRISRWALLAAAIWLAGSSAIGIVAVEAALHPGRNPIGQAHEAHAQAFAAVLHAELTDVSVTAADGATLRGWFIQPAAGNSDAVILLHGVVANRAAMLGYAALLLRHGYAVLLPDARAHGSSGGDLATYGVWESDDIRRWVDWLDQAHSPGCVYGLGESMGAAQLLESLALEKGFCAVAAESAFASFREAGFDRVGQALGTGPWAGRFLLRPGVEVGFVYARLRYGIDFEEASPENAVAASSVPVLLIHGQMDSNLPRRHSEEILARNAGRSPAVALWEPADAEHCGGMSAQPKEFERRVVGWFADHRR
jgi:dipeptidyl aminopeptidase/acylaminoacyl peptidase